MIFFDELWGIVCNNNDAWAVADWMKNYIYVFDDGYNKLISRFYGQSEIFYSKEWDNGCKQFYNL